jgi:hypothetical protein
MILHLPFATRLSLNYLGADSGGFSFAVKHFENFLKVPSETAA